MRTRKKVIWTDNIIKIIKKVVRTSDSWSDAVYILKKKYEFTTDANTLRVMCTKNKIPRPKISENWGGIRRGKEIE